MFNPLKAGRKKLLKLVPGIIRYLESAKRNGTMKAEKADQLIAQLKSESEVAKENKQVKEVEEVEEVDGDGG